MSNSNKAEMIRGEALLKIGRSIKILAITVIVILSAGIALLVYGQRWQPRAMSDVIYNPSQWLGGFVAMMLLTVGYLVGKGLASSRYQRKMIAELLQEETVIQAQKLDPITQFHHPEVCRDILLRHAGYAGRLKSPLSLLQITISNLPKLSLDPQTRFLTEDLVRHIRFLCRPIDSLLRWTPNSFLLVLPEITESCLPAIHQRFRQELEQWFEKHVASDVRPVLDWRAVSDKLNTSGDILMHVQHLLDQEQHLTAAPEDEVPQAWRSEKSVAIAMELQINGTDGNGHRFQESIVTKRVAHDRIWFALNRSLLENSPLTITARNGEFQELATVNRLLAWEGKQLVEAQFATTPAHWIVGAA